MNRRLSENEGEDEMIGNDIARPVSSNWRIRKKYLSISSIGVRHILILGVSLALLANTALAALMEDIKDDLLAGSYLIQEYARETQNVGAELVQKGLTEEPSPIADEKDADLPEILGKRRYLPRKTAEANAKIEDVLLLYTETSENQANPFATLETAKLFKDLIDSHWNVNIHMKLVSEYEKGDISNFDILMYIGENFYTNIPKSLINDVNNTNKEVLWINYHVWALDTEKLGFTMHAVHSSDFDKISYRNYEFEFNRTDTSLVEVMDPEKAKVLAWLVDKEREKRIPAIVNANDNFLYVCYLPLTAPHLDEPIPFLNALHETFGHHRKQATVLLRLEDINPGPVDYNLTSIDVFFKRKSVPYHFAVIPVYVNPKKNLRMNISDDPVLIKTLKSMQLGNGELVLHGYTHQYDGETGVDFEFWDESKNEPIKGESREFAQERVTSALNELKKAKLSTDIWETPHYQASQVHYEIFKETFPIIYDLGSGISMPFVFRRDNTIFSPLDLGYVSYVSSAESVEKILSNAKKIRDCFEDPSVSFFYHPYLFGDEELGKRCLNEIIDSLRDLGYEFRSIYDLLQEERSFEEKVISAKRNFQKGVVLAAYSKDKYFSYQINEELDHLADMGVEWVKVQTFLYQNNIHSSSMFVDGDRTASDESLEYIINKLHKRRFKVLLELVVNLKYEKSGEWMGTITPDNWDRWFESYNTLIEHYAKLAQKNEVEQLVVGVELTSTHRFKEKWEQIIDNTRKHYQGSIVFVANFDVYDTVPFWDKLDAIGMNFYFPINRSADWSWYQPWSKVKDKYNDPSYEDLLEGWQLWVDTLDRWQKKMNKPILVTEIGYTSQRGCTYQPWSRYLGESDFEEQYLAYKALFEVWSKKQIVDGKFDGGNYLQGIYFFNWSSKKPENDRSYIPSEAAKSIIRKWFAPNDSS